MRNLWRYFVKRSIHVKLPQLHKSLKNPYEMGAVSDETALVMMIGRVRDPFEADKLLAQYRATSAAELLSRLPKRPPPDYRTKLQNWLRRIEGAYAKDPHAEDHEQARNLHG